MNEQLELFRAPSAPEPKVYVPMWSDGTPKAEKFLNGVERIMIEESKRRRDEWHSRFAYEARRNNGGL
jgi:hypothetical protein